MGIVQIASDGSKDLPFLQTIVQQQEGIFGPITALASMPPNNVLSFQVGPSPAPAKRAVLESFTDHPPQKDKHELICIGNCLVSGKTAKMAAYRPVD
jgi:hypothetical protein